MFTKEANKFMYNKVSPISARRPVRGTSSYHSKSNSNETWFKWNDRNCSNRSAVKSWSQELLCGDVADRVQWFCAPAKLANKVEAISSSCVYSKVTPTLEAMPSTISIHLNREWFRTDICDSSLPDMLIVRCEVAWLDDLAWTLTKRLGEKVLSPPSLRLLYYVQMLDRFIYFCLGT